MIRQSPNQLENTCIIDQAIRESAVNVVNPIVVVHVGMDDVIAQRLKPAFKWSCGEEVRVSHVEASAQRRMINLFQHVTDNIGVEFPHVLDGKDNVVIVGKIGHAAPEVHVSLLPANAVAFGLNCGDEIGVENNNLYPKLLGDAYRVLITLSTNLAYAPIRAAGSHIHERPVHGNHAGYWLQQTLVSGKRSLPVAIQHIRKCKCHDFDTESVPDGEIDTCFNIVSASA